MALPKSSEDVKNLLVNQVQASLGISLLHVGLQTGVWRAMASNKPPIPMTPHQLATLTGLSERYLEELLRACALHGYVTFNAKKSEMDVPEANWDSGIRRDGGTFLLSPQLSEVLVNEESPFYYGSHLSMPVLLR